MKRLFTLLGLSLLLTFPFNSNAQTYITEDFTTFNDSVVPPLASGWKNIDSTNPANGQIWRFDNPQSVPVGTPMSGKVAILDSDFYGPGAAQDAYLVSPNFDASMDSVVILEFDHFFQNLGGNVADVEVWDGFQWNIVASFAGTTTANAASETIDISTWAAGVASAQIRFHYTGNYAWHWMIDNINVFQPQPEDLAVLSVDSLINGCNLDSIQIRATVQNVGTAPISSFTMNYTINGGAPVSENITTSLAAGAILNYTFSTYANVSTVGTYNFVVYSSSRSDINNVNDTATGTSQHLISTSSFPYVEGFETGNGGWISGGANSSWALGTPANATINSAAGGTQAWVTNLTGTYNSNEVSFVTSPCFDFSALAQPQFKMNIWIETENGWDGAILESSIDGGSTWQTVGSLNDPINWYNGNANAMNTYNAVGECWVGNSPIAPGGWILAERDLTGLAGQSSVRLRVLFASDGSVQEEGFAFDNVVVQDAPANDAGIDALLSPINGCGLSATDTIRVILENAGSTSISNFDVSAVLNAGTPITETFTGTIAPGATANYTFTNTLNLSAVGSYNLMVYTSLTGDGNAFNDTLETVIENIPIVSTFPYNQGFETGTGGWVSGGQASTWALGAPANTIINSAAGGSLQAWVTNLTGPYNNNELSFVESPCFDFTSLAQPQIKLNIWIESEGGWDGMILQSSIDGGLTWQRVGALNDPINWYNGNSNAMNTATGSGDSWNGGSPIPPGGWILAERDLTGLAGQSAVRLRLFFASDGSVQQEGIAFDNILIQDAPATDGKLVAISAPQTGCGLGAADTVKVLIENVGSGILDTIPLSYSVNGGTIIIDTSFASIAPGAIVEHAFSTPFNFSVGGTYNIFAEATIPGDANTLNDTVSAEVENTLSTLQTVPYLETFDGTGFISGTGFDNVGSTLGNGWTASPAGSPDFFWGARNSPTGSGGTGPDVDHTGNNGNFIYVEGSNGANGSIAELYSPCIDLSGTTNPTLEFWYHKFGNDMGTLYIDVFNGSVWNNIDSIAGAIQTATTDPYLSRTVSLVSVAGNVTQIRFRSGPKTGFATDMAIDDVRVFEPGANDAGVDDIIRPISGCGLSATDSIEVVLENTGSASISNFDVVAILNGGTPITETFTGTLTPGTTANFVFSNTLNLSTAGTYSLRIYTSLTGDSNPFNDTLDATVESVPVVASYPYNEGFETGSGGWISNGTSNSWQRGVPAGAVINTAAGGTQAWVTNLTGTYNPSELSYVESPCFDFTSLALPQIKVNLFLASEGGWDGMILQSSIDNGLTWQTVGSVGDPINWYNGNANAINAAFGIGDSWNGNNTIAPGGWILAERDLTGLGGQSSVRLRFFFASDGSVQQEGIGFDNVLILDAPAVDAKLVDISAPQSSCGFGPADSVKVLITNAGSGLLDTIPVSYRVNAGVVNVDTSFTPINPGDTIEFTFNNTYNFSTVGNYLVEAEVNVPGDGNTLNDTVSKVIENSLKTVPYLETFDGAGFVSGTGFDNAGSVLANGWSANPSASPDFFWGVRTGATGSGATGPDDDWNGNANYVFVEGSNGANGSIAELYSPCIDLTGTNTPTLDFWYHKYGNANMPVMYIDLFDGTNWIVLDSIVGSTHTANADPFLNYQTSLNAYIGSTIQIRFRSGAKVGFESDMAIDNFYLVDQPVGLESKANNAFNFSIYPNPSEGEFTLQNGANAETYSVMILDAKGKTVYNQNINFQSGERRTIDLTNQSKGIYFMRLNTDTESFSRRIIIQ